MDSVCQVFNVLRGDTSNADSSILGQVNVEFVGKSIDLLWVQTGVAEHSNLVCNV